MPKSKTEKLRKLALKRQFVTAKDTGTLGIPRTCLHSLPPQPICLLLRLRPKRGVAL